MRYDGEFRPPSLGSTVRPIPVTGAGFCELREDGLHVEGQASAVGAALLLALVGGLAAAGGALLVKTLFFSGMSLNTVAITGVVGLVSGAAAPSKGKPGKPVTHTIPWDRIAKVKADPSQPEGAMVIVKRHQPKGAIHFVPKDREDFMAEIANRAGIRVG